MSKTDELAKAAEKRHEIQKKIAEDTQPAPPPARAEDRMTDAELEGLKEKAEVQAEHNVQGRAGTLTGEIDIEAMGDVKGDGGDAKYYDDDDPAKALGVPVYEHGLNQTKGGVDEVVRAATKAEPSASTKAEMERGARAVGDRSTRDYSKSSDNKTTATKKDTSK